MEGYPFTNELIHESSPYLLEHAHNPVNWYPWGEKALAKARKEDKPIIISIGYSSCHWCHVMEKESYSDTAVADFMNACFIAIKVDREERPDIDQIYMNAAMLISGSGGWPLNAFTLPDGRPFYAATYFPKNQWMELLKQIERVYRQENSKVIVHAENLTNGINNQEPFEMPADLSGIFQLKTYNGIFKNWQSLIDYNLGGFAKAPKFPMPNSWEFLLQYYYLTKDEQALKAVTTTLDNMAKGGIYDQIGGGFARYSTDQYWKVPHFEKMLYDNGQLVSLYSHAYQVTTNPLYEEIINETLGFIKRELTSEQGGFYSSLNADSEGEEGKFYTWSKRELDGVLTTLSSGIISGYYQVTENGNWEKDSNILHTILLRKDYAAREGLTFENFSRMLQESKDSLLEVRNKRIRPSTDDKILTSWNAIMLKGYIDAFRALGNPDYLETALKNAAFLDKNMMIKEGGLWRNFKDGKANIPAFLDDYSLLAQAFIELYQVTFDIHWLNQARALTDYSIAHFYDEKSQMFYYASDKSVELISRKLEIPDNVIPSSNSVTARNLFMIGKYFDHPGYSDMSDAMLVRQLTGITSGSPYYSNWTSLFGLHISEPYEIAIMGDDAISRNMQMQSYYLPTSIFMGGSEENLPLLAMKKIDGKTRIYICRNKSCQAPVDEVQEAISAVIP